MTGSTMGKLTLVIGVVCIALAVMIFLSSAGLRRYYSSIFFAGIGCVLLASGWRWLRS